MRVSVRVRARTRVHALTHAPKRALAHTPNNPHQSAVITSLSIYRHNTSTHIQAAVYSTCQLNTPGIRPLRMLFFWAYGK